MCLLFTLSGFGSGTCPHLKCPPTQFKVNVLRHLLPKDLPNSFQQTVMLSSCETSKCFIQLQNQELKYLPTSWGFPYTSVGKESACNAGDLSSIPGLGRSPGEGNDNSSILAWRISWTEEPGRLQSMGSQELEMT